MDIFWCLWWSKSSTRLLSYSWSPQQEEGKIGEVCVWTDSTLKRYSSFYKHNTIPFLSLSLSKIIDTKNYRKKKKFGRFYARLLEVINTTWENLQMAKHKISSVSGTYWFVLCKLQIFSGCVYQLEQSRAHSFFLYPIVFGINAIPFFWWREGRCGRTLYFDNLSLVLRSLVAPFERGGTESANFLATKSVNSMHCLATMVIRSFVKGGTKVRIFGKGKREHVHNSSPISALSSWRRYRRDVTSVFLCPPVSHLTNNIPSATALGIITCIANGYP